MRDILTGACAEAALSIDPPNEVASVPLPPIEFRVERVATDWPEGEWEPIPEDDGTSVAEMVRATAKVKALSRKIIRYGKYNGSLHLMTGFTLENSLRRYELKYLACCDPKVFDPGPPQQVRGLNGSGLGISKPRAHLWYYNSYLKIFLGEDEMVLGYELAKIEDLTDETTARVRLEWLTPAATVRLEYVMIPGHEGLFHRLSIQPNAGQAVNEARVNFYSYPAGFGKGGEPFFEVAQEDLQWLLMGDAVRDRDFYESGLGSAGLLIRPEQWTEVKYGARPLLLARRPEAEATRPWRLHWVTWIFPERGNAAAREYMRTNSEWTGERLKELFSVTRN
jgi:hypothetical protein